MLSGVTSQIDDPRSVRHTGHSLLQMLRQRVYQVAAGYEDCNDANHLKVDPALRLALGKEHESGAGQSALSRFENNFLARHQGLTALEKAISRSADTLLR
ncbi:MAG: transposase, partial [Syntrophobacteraceae bacterium]